MTITKKLYLNFGAILALVVFLFIVNVVTVQRSSRSLELAQATEALRFQMMQNRLNLDNFLLSGSGTDLQKFEEGVRGMPDLFKAAEAKATSPQQQALFVRLREAEDKWGESFSRPLVEKRKAVEAGNATVAELQLYYAQLDP